MVIIMVIMRARPSSPSPEPTAFAHHPPAPLVQASEFKAKCLALMDEVARTGQALVVTKNGRPVVEVRAVKPPRAVSPFGLHPQVVVHGDVISPIIPADDWEALR